MRILGAMKGVRMIYDKTHDFTYDVGSHDQEHSHTYSKGP